MIRNLTLISLLFMTSFAQEVSNINKIVLLKENGEKIIKIQTSNGEGILSNTKKEILSPIYNQIKVINILESTLYIAQQILNEADLLINLYVTSDGKIIKNQALKINEKNKIECLEE